MSDPLAVNEILRLFGSAFHWVRGFSSEHDGIDLSAPEGTPVYWFGGPATVIYARDATGDPDSSKYWTTGGGNVVNVWLGANNRGTNWVTQFAHLHDIAVKPGQYIERGTLIGHVGQTGNATGPHLHFGIFDKSSGSYVPMDPVPWLTGRSWPGIGDIIGQIGDQTGIGGAVAAAQSAAQTLGDVVAFLGNPANWLRIFAIIAAAFLLSSSMKMLYDTSK